MNFPPIITTTRYIANCDPDFIIGHNAYGYGLDVLASRLALNKIPEWSRLSRLRRPANQAVFNYRKNTNGLNFHVVRNMTVGRIVCDSLVMCKDLLPKQVSYDLHILAAKQLGMPVPPPPTFE